MKRDLVDLRASLEHAAVDGILLVEVVERLVVLLEARELGVLLQDAQEERVERAEIHLVRGDVDLLLGEAARDARQELAGSLLGEGRDEDRLGRNVADADEMDDALDDRLRLARAGPGDDEKRAIAVLDDLLFLRLERHAVPRSFSLPRGE